MPSWVFFAVLLLYALWGRRYRVADSDQRPAWFFVLGCVLMLAWAWLLIVAAVDGSGWTSVVRLVGAGFLLLVTCLSIFIRVRARGTM